jgi:hypothetical protein
MSTRSVLAVLIASVVTSTVGACTIGVDSTETVGTSTSAPSTPSTTLTTGPSDVSTSQQTPSIEDTQQPGMTLGPDGSMYPARPGSEEVAVDPEPFANAGADGDGYFFTSPTGNIACAIYPAPSSAGPVGCQAVTSVAPVDGPVCSNADNDKYAVRIETTGAVHTCTTQGIYTASDAVVLEYGETLTVGDATCVSREDGISCLLAGSNAVLMSRGANLTY